MASRLQFKAQLPTDILSLGNNAFRPEHQMVWSAILAQNYAYRGSGWQKGNGGTLSTSENLSAALIRANTKHPLSPAATIDAILHIESHHDLIESAAEDSKAVQLDNASGWLKAYGDLVKLRFSQIDEQIWEGLAHTIDSEGRHIIIAPTGRATEYKVVGTDAEEIYSWFASVTMPKSTQSRLSHIEDHIVDIILEQTEGLGPEDTTPSAVLNGNLFPASAMRSLVGKEPVFGENGFIGFRLTTKGRKITALDYVKSAFESFAAREKFRVAKVTAISNDPKEPCYRYLDISPKAAGTWDTWRQWMDETFELESAKLVFMAWCGSLLDAGNTGKQSIWLHGHGNDGKSKIANALIGYLADGACSINGKSMTNQFGLAKLEGKRLVVISDNKNQKLLQTEWAHNLTGGDSVDIERKGMNSYSAKLIGKLMICANVAPEIRTDEANQVSRLIYIKMRRRTPEELIAKKMAIRMPDGSVAFVGNNEFPSKLEAEVGAYMQHCYGIYSGMAPTRSDIPLTAEIMEATEAGASDPQSEAIADLVHDIFEFDTSSEISVREVSKAIVDCAKDYGLSLSNFTVSDINNFLINNGAKKVRVANGVTRERVWRGIKLKQASGL